MQKTLKTWIMTGLIGGSCSIALLWNAPQVINSNYWWVGFLMDGAAIVFPIAFGARVFTRLQRATKVAVLIHRETKVWVSSWECLDVPRMSRDECLERLEVFKSERELFESPLHVLKGKK
jgi:hypothetical protein